MESSSNRAIILLRMFKMINFEQLDLESLVKIAKLITKAEEKGKLVQLVDILEKEALTPEQLMAMQVPIQLGANVAGGYLGYRRGKTIGQKKKPKYSKIAPSIGYGLLAPGAGIGYAIGRYKGEDIRAAKKRKRK